MATHRRTEILVAFYQLVAAIRYQNPDRWRDIKLQHKVSDYFPGGAESFADEVNKYVFFLTDNIVMHPNDFSKKNTLSELYDEIIKKYLAKYGELEV